MPQKRKNFFTAEAKPFITWSQTPLFWLYSWNSISSKYTIKINLPHLNFILEISTFLLKLQKKGKKVFIFYFFPSSMTLILSCDVQCRLSTTPFLTLLLRSSVSFLKMMLVFLMRLHRKLTWSELWHISAYLMNPYATASWLRYVWGAPCLFENDMFVLLTWRHHHFCDWSIDTGAFQESCAPAYRRITRTWCHPAKSWWADD